MEQPWRPTLEQLRAADGRTVPDVIGQDLKVLFCGINPGRYSGAVGHHFARPGNRFWKALHAAGFTPRVLSPFEEQALLEYGLGSPTWSSGRRPRPPSYGVRSWRRVPVV